MAPSLRGEGKTVLVADDAPEIVDMVDLILSKRGFEVLRFDNGMDALGAVRENRPDLVLLDIIMPGMDGLEVCTRIKDDPELKSTPVILITSVTADSDLADGFWNIGAPSDDFMTKPFNPHELAARVDRLLFGTELPPELRRGDGQGAQRADPE